MSDSVDVGGPTAAVLREAMGRTQRAVETDAIDDISASFNYDSKVRSAPGKLWVEHYPGWLWVYAHFMIDRNTRVRELCSGGTRLLDVG